MHRKNWGVIYPILRKKPCPTKIPIEAYEPWTPLRVHLVPKIELKTPTPPSPVDGRRGLGFRVSGFGFRV